MRRALLLLTLLLAAPLAAQQADDEPGFFSRLFSTDAAASDEQQGSLLERLIQDQLSDDTRTVSVEGFSGALSGAATLERLTISDADGVWFTLEDAQLDWNRAALFTGSLEVTELTAARIDLPRLPAPAETPPTPEASGGFALPDLPVSIDIGRIGAETVTIGEPVFGAAADVSVDGSFSLIGGEGAANLAVARLDGRGGVTLDAAYTNTTQNLALDLALQEDADGIFANLVGLPGTPSVDFAIQSDAPLSDFTATVRLATDGAERLAGTITLNETEGTRRITADIGGDIAPVFAPDYRPFFGDAITLRADARIGENGAVSVPEFALTADAINLSGAVELTDGMPQVISVNGEIATEDGTPALLPLSGTETRIDRADLDISFDAAQSDDWTAAISLIGLDRNDLTADRISLTGTGRIITGDAQQVTASLRFNTNGLSMGDAGIDTALGETLNGRTNIDWTGGSIQITDLLLDANTLSLAGDAEVTMPESGLQMAGDLALSAQQIADFSTLAGRALSGSAELETSFQIAPIANTFDIRALGETRDLTIDDPRADAILAGVAHLDLQATRDEEGLRVQLQQLASAAADITAAADLKSGGSTISLEAQLNETSLVIDSLSGPSRITFDGQEDSNRDWTIDTALTGPSFTVALDGRATDLYDLPAFTGDIRLTAQDLSAFSELADRNLGGSIDVAANGSLNANLSSAALSAEINSTDLSLDQPQADTLLAGAATARLQATKSGDTISVAALSVITDLLEARGNGRYAGPDTEAIFEARLADTAPFAEGLSGPLAFSGVLGREDSAGQRDLQTLLEGETYSASVAGKLKDIFNAPSFEGAIAASAQNLATFAALANRPLTGQLNLEADAKLNADMHDIALNANINGSNLAIGQADADRLLAGTLTATLDAAQQGDTITINALSLSTAQLDATASGQLADETDEITFDARLANIASFVDGFSGPVSLAGSVGRADENLSLDVSATGPGGARADLQGTIAEDMSTANLTTSGSAPLGLANRFIQPRSITGTTNFNLALRGAPVVSNLSGQITTTGTRVSLPRLNAALEDISGAINLSGGTARLDLGGGFREGGRLAVSGPIGLDAPNSADLGITLTDIKLSDPRLYETTIDGTVRIAGPLAGGARIAGRLGLGETNIRIPDSSIGGSGAVPEIVHINEPPPVRGTRRRAGLLATSGESGGSSGSNAAFPLDVTINAPNRIFVRGRGLDSEFGGNLRLTGTTANVVPLGAFQLIRGRLDILGQRLALENARITMSGDFTPFLELLASTDADEFRINIDVEGEADKPDITFSSSPELPQEEVLSRLIFGRGLDTISPLQAARLALAVRTLAGQGGEGVVGRIRGDTGLADLDVTTDDDGNAAVRAGAYLGENVYSDVTVNSEGETELNLNLDITPSLTARGGVNSEGNTSLGIFFERDY